VSKRPEISVNDFAKALDLVPSGIIPFAPKLFGPAANNGQMIAEVEAAGKVVGMIRDLALKITGRTEMRKAKRNLLDPLIMRFGRKQASKADRGALHGASPTQS
jgi:pilus assembly protein CpaE